MEKQTPGPSGEELWPVPAAYVSRSWPPRLCLADLVKCLPALRSKESPKGRNQSFWVRRLRGHSLKNIFTRRELSPTSSNYAPIQPAHNGLLR